MPLRILAAIFAVHVCPFSHSRSGAIELGQFVAKLLHTDYVSDSVSDIAHGRFQAGLIDRGDSHPMLLVLLYSFSVPGRDTRPFGAVHIHSAQTFPLCYIPFKLHEFPSDRPLATGNGNGHPGGVERHLGVVGGTRRVDDVHNEVYEDKTTAHIEHKSAILIRSSPIPDFTHGLFPASPGLPPDVISNPANFSGTNEIRYLAFDMISSQHVLTSLDHLPTIPPDKAVADADDHDSELSKIFCNATASQGSVPTTV